ncbi:Hypothetical protein NTJ_10647 [Nesidiocoris tenuis]|uniref:Uncharacterized protein n=1 Tax=Nesidiocoris tenuis TaxID=355587 RepID=A0ABN7B0S4_9HEMI|nr:Hypothetical protein NTJ_10647 [Nesidiocoris tenuis]
MKRSDPRHRDRTNYGKTAERKEKSEFGVKNEQKETLDPLEEEKDIPEDNELIKKKDDDLKNRNDSALAKILSKNGKFRRFFRRLQEKWIRWAGFQIEIDHTASNIRKERELKTYGVPGYDEIACIEVEVPDIMSTEVDRIRTTCRECISHPPDLPNRDQVKMKLMAADRYFGADGSSNSDVLERKVDHHEEDGSMVQPTWRFILERPLVEQYVLMNNYIRRTSILYEQQDRSQRKKLIEERVAENDSKYEDFTMKHQTETKRLLRSMHRPKLADTAVQTTMHLEDDTTNAASEFSFYPNSDHSTTTQYSTQTSHESFMPRNDSNYLDDIGKPSNANTAQVNWWESKNTPRTSVIYPTSGESAAKPNSGSGSEGPSTPFQFPTHKSRGGIAAKLRKASETPKKIVKKSKKVTFASVIRPSQKPVKKPAMYVIQLGIGTEHSSGVNSPTKTYVQPLIVRKSLFEKLQQNIPNAGTEMANWKHPGDNQPRDKSYQASRISSVDETEQSTSSEAIKLKPSPAGFFGAGAVTENLAFYGEGSDNKASSVEQLKKYFEATQDADTADHRRSPTDRNRPSPPPLVSDRNNAQSGFGAELPLISGPHRDKDSMTTQQKHESDALNPKAGIKSRHEDKTKSSPPTSKFKVDASNRESNNKTSNASVIMQSRVFSLNSMFTTSDNLTNFNPPNSAKKPQALLTESNSHREAGKTVHEKIIKPKTSSFAQEQGQQKKTKTVKAEPASTKHERPVKTSLSPLKTLFAESLQEPQEVGLLTRTERLRIKSHRFDGSCDNKKPTKLKTEISSAKSSAIDNYLAQIGKLSESKRSTESDTYRKWLTGNVPSTVGKSSSTMKKWLDSENSSNISKIEKISIAPSSKQLVFQLHKKDVLDDDISETK